MFGSLLVKRLSLSSAMLLAGFGQAAFGQSDFHHLTVNAGGGYTALTGALGSRLEGGGNFQAGAGYNFNSAFSVNGTFTFNQLGISRSALNEANQPDGNARVYALTVDPKLKLPLFHGFGPYVLAGGGWLRRTVEYTQPTIASTYIFDPWFGYLGPVFVPANQVLGSFSQNTGVWDVGGGVDIPLPRTGIKLYAEARYYEGFTNNTHTTIIPITFGLRW